MLYGLVVVIHIIACMVLIAVILLQAGRGGGLSESFGVSSTQTIFGTKANVFLKRATQVCAIAFLLTCILLGVMTSRRGRSLIQLKPPITGAQNIPFTLPSEEGEEGVPELPPAKPEAPPPK